MRLWHCLLLNLAAAVAGAFLWDDHASAGFLAGWVAGLAAMACLRPVSACREHVRRSLAFLGFLAVFVSEFLKSNVSVARIILFRRSRDIRPMVFEYPVEGLRPVEILLLAQVITLTPGTCTLEVREDLKVLVVHVLEGGDPQAVATSIRDRLERPMLKFTR